MKHLGADPSVLDTVHKGNVGVSGRKSPNYAKLFPESSRRAFQTFYRHDFSALGYSPLLHCIEE